MNDPIDVDELERTEPHKIHHYKDAPLPVGEVSILEEYRRLEEVAGQMRAELVGVLKSGVNVGRMSDERMVYVSEQHRGIDAAIAHLHPKKFPTTLVLAAMIILGVMVMFTLNPSYGRELGAYMSQPQNQIALGFILVIVLGIAYLYFRRRSRSSANP